MKCDLNSLEPNDYELIEDGLYMVWEKLFENGAIGLAERAKYLMTYIREHHEWVKQEDSEMLKILNEERLVDRACGKP